VTLGQGLAVVPPVGNPTGTPVLSIGTGNIQTGLLYDPSFWCAGTYTGSPIDVPSAGRIIFWNYSGSGTVTVRNDGGNDDLYYVRLTNATEQVNQGITCTPGEGLNCSCMMRSNNVGAPHGFYLQVLFYDMNGSYVSTGVAASTSGYIADWKKLAGYVPVPATACYAIIQCIVINTETSGGYWDVDTVLIQHVPNQSGGGQTTTMAGNGLGFQAANNIDASIANYGKSLFLIVAADGTTQVSGGTLGGPAAYYNVGAGSGGGTMSAGLEATPGTSYFYITRSGVTSNGYTGPVTGRSAIGGIVV